jgi:hypothetical protein
MTDQTDRLIAEVQSSNKAIDEHLVRLLTRHRTFKERQMLVLVLILVVASLVILD